MLALATQPYDRFLVSDIESERKGPTYTVDTLRALRERLPVEQLYFLMGSDSFSQIGTWNRWQELVELAHLVVLHRRHGLGRGAGSAGAGGAAAAACARSSLSGKVPDPEPGSRWIYLLEHEPFPISATHLRERLRAGLTIHELVPPEVHRYIVKHRLYHQGDERSDGS